MQSPLDDMPLALACCSILSFLVARCRNGLDKVYGEPLFRRQLPRELVFYCIYFSLQKQHLGDVVFLWTWYILLELLAGVFQRSYWWFRFPRDPSIEHSCTQTLLPLVTMLAMPLMWVFSSIMADYSDQLLFLMQLPLLSQIPMLVNSLASWMRSRGHGEHFITDVNIKHYGAMAGFVAGLIYIFRNMEMFSLLPAVYVGFLVFRWIPLMSFPRRGWNRMAPQHELAATLPVATAEELERLHAEDTECVVCISPMEEALKLPCGHFFHAHCILRWFQQHTTCPVCRHDALQPMPNQGSAANAEAADGAANGGTTGAGGRGNAGGNDEAHGGGNGDGSHSFGGAGVSPRDIPLPPTTQVSVVQVQQPLSLSTPHWWNRWLPEISFQVQERRVMGEVDLRQRQQQGPTPTMHPSNDIARDADNADSSTNDAHNVVGDPWAGANGEVNEGVVDVDGDTASPDYELKDVDIATLDASESSGDDDHSTPDLQHAIEEDVQENTLEDRGASEDCPTDHVCTTADGASPIIPSESLSSDDFCIEVHCNDDAKDGQSCEYFPSVGDNPVMIDEDSGDLDSTPEISLEESHPCFVMSPTRFAMSTVRSADEFLLLPRGDDQ